jgi:hypothetical protein
MENDQTFTEWARTFLSDTNNLALTGAALAFLALCSWRVFARTGHNGALGLLMFVPGVNVIMLGILAFGRWPMDRTMKSLQSKSKAARDANQILERAA